MSEPAPADLTTMLSEVLAPLLRADGNDLYLVESSKKELRLHVTGKLSGSPGTPDVIEHVIAPAVAAIDKSLKLIVTSGWLVPKTAVLVEPA
jgi:hypothetical protein